VLDRLGVHSVTLRDQAPGSRDVVGGLADAVGVLSSLAVLAAIALVTWLYVRGGRDRVVACAAAVAGFVAFAKVLSPQYLTWLVPLVPAAGVAEAGTLAVALVLTHLEWDRFVQSHGSVESWGRVLGPWILVRDLVLVGLFALLAFRLRVEATSRSRR
jgi:hypothetical protein